jgi:hypothetical protein
MIITGLTEDPTAEDFQSTPDHHAGGRRDTRVRPPQSVVAG